MGGGGRLARLIISDVTWSLQNNLVTFFGMDYWFNFLSSLVVRPFTDRSTVSDFASSSALGSGHLGSFGIRRGGIMQLITEDRDTPGLNDRAFTTQHIVFSSEEGFSQLDEVRVFDPGETFEPTLYGSLLIGRPDGDPGRTFVLEGMGNRAGAAGARRWSRSGGAARAASPGAVVPVFPAGGFHIDNTHPATEFGNGAPLGIHGPKDCQLVEATIGGDIGTAIVVDAGQATISVDGIGAIAAGGLILVAAGAVTRFVEVLFINNATSTLGIGDDLADLVGQVTVQAVDAAVVSTDNLPLAGAVASALSVAGGPLAMIENYQPSDLLRLVAATGEVSAARVTALEAQVALDRALPAAIVGPILVWRTVAAAPVTATLTAPDTLEFASTPPTVTIALIESGANQLTVNVSPGAAPNELVAAEDIEAALGIAVGDTVQFTGLTRGTPLGRRDAAAEADPILTYAPNANSAVPDASAGAVAILVEDTATSAVRLVTGAPNHNVVVIDQVPVGTGPFDVERRTLVGAAVDATVNARTNRLIVDDPAIVPDRDDGVLQLLRVVGNPPQVRQVGVPAAPLTLGVNAAGAVLTTVQPANAPVGEPRPGQVVIADPGGVSELVSVTQVQVTVTLDREVPDLAAEGVRAVLLDNVGTIWAADRIDAERLRLRPLAVQPAGAAIPVEFPRLQEGETVHASWNGGGAGNEGRYRVSAADGLTIRMAGDVDVPAGAADVTVQRIVPVDPGTGTELVARDGVPVAGSSPTEIQFSVWSPDHLAAGTVIGLITDEATLPAVISDDPMNQNQDVVITLAAPTGAAGAIDIGMLDAAATAYVAGYTTDDDGLIVDAAAVPAADFTTDAANTVLVVPFVDSDDAARSVDGSLVSGTLLIPEDETQEVDRHQSLTDHELRHTQQYSWFGPLWFNLFPLWALELGFELGTDVDLPDFGPFVSAQVSPSDVANQWLVKAEDATGIETVDRLQVVSGTQHEVASVETIDGTDIVVKTSRNKSLPTGDVQVRVRNESAAWDIVYGILSGLSHGGLLNYTWSYTYGELIYLISKGVYGIHRAIKGIGDLHPAEVIDETHIKLTLGTGVQALSGASVVIIRSGDDTVIRTGSLDRDDETTLVVRDPIPFTGSVSVAPYDSHDPRARFDWNDYVPAEVVDTSNPFEVTVLGGFSHSFEAGDRAEILYREERDGKPTKELHSRTDVTFVDGNTVQLGDPVPVTSDGDRFLRLADLGTRDPMHSSESTEMTRRGLGWMQYVFDPYRQIQNADSIEPGTFWDVIARIARHGLGTHAWSLPPSGYVWWSRLFRESESHLTFIEKDASAVSGDLYSAMGRLFGQNSKRDGFAQRSMVVGDVSRYWYWSVDRNDTVIVPGLMGAPGVHSLGPPQTPPLPAAPFWTSTLVTVVDRVGTDSDPAGVSSGRIVPDVFAEKNPVDPTILDPRVTGPTGLIPSVEGFVPLTPTMQRCLGSYVAFTQPGTHRAGTRDGLRIGRSQDVHDDADSREIAPLFFDITVTDVTVTVAGQEIANGDTITLVLTQMVTVSVAPGGGREYAVTVGRPSASAVLRAGGDTLTAQLAAGAGEDVEVSRHYRDNAGTYSGGLDRHGTKLGGDVHVPVRQFTVDVVDTVPIRAALDPDEPGQATFAQTESGFVLVPADIVMPLAVTSFDGAAPTDDTPVTVQAATVDADSPLRAFLGPCGQAFEVVFGDDPVVAGPVDVVLEVVVGTVENPATLTCTIQLEP